MAQQLAPFALDPPADSLPVQVTRDASGYRATLLGGWYIGHGDTPQQAAERCAEAYEREAEMLCQ